MSNQDSLSLCRACYCMTKTLDGKCGKCGAKKYEPNQDSQDKLELLRNMVYALTVNDYHRSKSMLEDTNRVMEAINAHTQKAVTEARKEAYEDVASKAGNGVTVRRYAKTRAFQHAFELTKGDGHE